MARTLALSTATGTVDDTVEAFGEDGHVGDVFVGAVRDVGDLDVPVADTPVDVSAESSWSRSLALPLVAGRGDRSSKVLDVGLGLVDNFQRDPRSLATSR